VQVIDNYGQVKVTTKNTAKPLPMTYIKVYSRMKNGTTSFYKDGYTDRRGRFDYASLSTSKLVCTCTHRHSPHIHSSLLMHFL
jgi:hypothetical protein